MTMRVLRDVLAGPGPVFGAWCSIDNSFSAELVGRAGFDWVCVDMQHGHVTSSESLVPMLQVLNKTDTPSLVRIPWKTDFAAIMHALDSGAQGVIIPMVDTPEEAALAAGACRYPPRGFRSWGPVRISLEVDDYTPQVGSDLAVCMVMIETKQALARVDEIMAVPGVDGAYIGPADLTISHGGGMNFHSDNKVLRDLAAKVLEACERHGKIPAFHGDGPLEATAWARQGFRMINVTADSGLIRRGAALALSQLREAMDTKP
jgi:4-hydroxy-2-oxoheptanedioate aldolase